MVWPVEGEFRKISSFVEFDGFEKNPFEISFEKTLLGGRYEVHEVYWEKNGLFWGDGLLVLGRKGDVFE